MKEQKEVLTQYLMQLSVICGRLASCTLYSKGSNYSKIFNSIKCCSDQSLVAVKQIKEVSFETELRKVLEAAFAVDLNLQDAGYNDKEFSNLYFKLKSLSAGFLSEDGRSVAA